MNTWLSLVGVYLLGFIVFYLFEIQDREKFSELYVKTIDAHTLNINSPQREADRQKAKQIYGLVVLFGSILWPVWMVRQLIQL